MMRRDFRSARTAESSACISVRSISSTRECCRSRCPLAPALSLALIDPLDRHRLALGELLHATPRLARRLLGLCLADAADGPIHFVACVQEILPRLLPRASLEG